MIKKRIFNTMVGVAMLTLSFGAPALAASGSVELNNEDITPFTVENVGGGTWNYGTTINDDEKHVWSDYVHHDNYHSSTALIGDDRDKDYADAGDWTDADAYGLWYEKGYAYWDNDA